jgi:hypothetical protein
VHIAGKKKVVKPAREVPLGGIERTPGQNRYIPQAGFNHEDSRVPPRIKQSSAGVGEPSNLPLCMKGAMNSA